MRRGLNTALAAFLSAGVLGAASPASSEAAYNHISVCKATLGGFLSDNDVRNWRGQIGAKSFNRWGAAGHYSDGSAYVWGYFNLSFGKVVLSRGRCSGGDWRADWFQGS